MSVAFPPVPPQLKQLNHFLKVAAEHETRDPVVAYWARFHAVQVGLTIDKTTAEAKTLLFSLLEWLERRKKELNDEAITNESVAEAHIENYAYKLFAWADGQERASVHNKNVVKTFYTAGVIFDILSNFTKDLSEDIEKRKKYAKWRAAYIHNCLKTGEVPEVPQESNYDYDEGAQDMHMPAEPSPSSSHSSVAPGPSGGMTFPSAGSQSWNFPSQPPPFNAFGGGGNTNLYSPQEPPKTAFVPAPAPMPSSIPEPAATPSGSQLSVEQIAKAQKYCKYAGSSLNFDDVDSAVLNLRKALTLLTTGEELVE